MHYPWLFRIAGPLSGVNPIREMILYSRNLLSLLAGLAALAVFACSASPASAGEYEVWSCRGPVGQPLSTEAWNVRSFDANPTDVSFSDDCASGGPVTLTVNPASTGSRRPRLEYTFDLPRGARITGYRMLRGLRAPAAFGGGYFYFAAIRETTGLGPHDFGCASALAMPDFQCSVQGSLTDPSDPGNVLEVDPVALDGLGLFVSCAATNGCTSGLPYAADAALFQSIVRIEDNVPPSIAEIGGSLAGSEPVHGEANLYVRATDDHAGIASISVGIDGQPVETISISSGNCSLPYEVPRPCPADAGRIFNLDTTGMSPGTHLASGTVTDAAGNVTPFGPVSFTVGTPGPVPANGSPAVHEPVLRLDPQRIWHSPGKPKVLTGRVATPGGVPVSGATLEVESTQLATGGTRVRALPPVITGTDGRFQVTMPGQGSRRIQITFAPGAGQAVTAQASAAARTRLRLGFRVNPRRLKLGRKATFRGRLAGAGPAAGRVPINIQARVAGSWSTIATVRTRPNGVFAWRYRFRYVKRNALFSFRAVADGGPGWPWGEARSVIRKVRVRSGSW